MSRSAFQSFVSRVSRPLAADLELQREVELELLGHLQDSAAAHRAAGHGDAEAVEAAIRAFGTEAELAEQLARVHRPRLLRRRLLRLTLAVGFLPVALLLAWHAAQPALVTIGSVLQMEHANDGLAEQQLLPALAESSHAQRLQTLAPIDREALTSISGPVPPAQRSAAAQRVAQALPDDRAAQANHLMLRWMDYFSLPEDSPQRSRAADNVLAAAQAARRTDPDNGFPVLIESAVLLTQATRLRELPESDLPTVRTPAFKGGDENTTFLRYELVDADRFAAGLARLHDAAQFAVIDSRLEWLVARQAKVLGSPTTLDEQLLHARRQFQIMLPYHSALRQIAHVGVAHAVAEAERGRSADAAALLSLVQQSIERFGASASTEIELLVALSHRSEATAAQIWMAERTGDSQRAAALRDRLRATQRALTAARLYDRSSPAALPMGYVESMIAGHGADYTKANPAPMRRAEYAVVDQLGVTGLFVLLVAMAGSIALPALIRVLGRTRVLWLTLDWRQSARIGLLAVILPVGLYLVYAVSPLSRRSIGIGHMWPRLMVEYGLVAAAISLLLLRLLRPALIARARELGVVISPCSGTWPRFMLIWQGALGVMGIAVLVLTRHPAAFRGTATIVPLLLWITTVMLAHATLCNIVALIWPVGRAQGGRNWRITPTRMVILGLLLVIIAGTVLLLTEGRLARRLEPVFLSFTLACCIGLLILSLMHYVKHRLKAATTARDETPPAPALAASASPVVALAAVVMLLTAAPLLRWSEHRAIASVDRRSTISLIDSFETSRYADIQKALRAELVNRYDQ